MIAQIACIFILSLISAWFVKRNDAFFIAFVILLSFGLKLVLFKIAPEIAYASGRYINMLLVLFFMYLILRYQINPLTNKYILLICAYLFTFWLYLYFNSLYKGINPLEYIHFFRNHFFNFVIVFFFIAAKKKGFKQNSCVNFIGLLSYLVLFEALLGLVQFQSITISNYFKIPYYLRHGEYIRRMPDMLIESKAIFGTLISAGDFNAVMSILAVFLGGIWFFKIYRPSTRIGRYIYISNLTLTVIVVLLGGFRLGLGSLIIGGLLILWFQRKWVCVLAGSVCFIGVNVLVGVYSQLIYAAARREYTIVEPFMRLMGLFAVFDPSIPSSNYLSLTRSIYLLDEFVESPFFGKGTMYLVGQYDSVTDAFLALVLVDLGLIGLLLVLLPHLYILKLVRNFCPKKVFNLLVVIFIVGLAQTMVDESFFQATVGTMFYAFAGICIYQFGRVEVSTTTPVS